MKALTVRQPWASLIADGRKTIEVRSWHTNYRGALAIHAGIHEPPAGDLRRWGLDPHALPYGAILATATLHDVQPYDADRHASAACLPGTPRAAYAWRLTDVRPLDAHVPCRGAQGLWSVPDAIRVVA